MNGSSATRSINAPPSTERRPAGLFAFLRRLSGRRADLGALLLGAVCAAALPPYGVVPALLLAIPGLLALIDGARGPLVAARRGWWFGFGLNLIGLYWITDAILVEADQFWWLVPLAVPALAVVMAVFVAVPAGLARCALPGWSRCFVLAGSWVLADLIRQFIATGFPWNPLGSVWELPGYVGDLFIQPAAWVGVHGLTLFTLILAGAVSRGRRGWGMAAVGLLLWAGFGLWRLDQASPPDATTKVVLVQGNVAQGAKWNQAYRNMIFERYLSLTRQAVEGLPPGTPAVVIWPETASPFLLEGDDAPARQAIQAASLGNPSLIGAVRFASDGRPRNSLFALEGTGQIDAVYDKSHLVPFGEYQPFWVPQGLEFVPGGGFASGPGPKVLRVPGLPPFGALICYEAIFPGEIVAPNDRPAWLVNVTNDAWFGDSSGPRQHLAAARMRAVEEGLPLVRAANTGISAVFDARGHETDRLALGQTGVVVAPLPGARSPTPFSRFGLIVPAILALAAVGMGWLNRVRSRLDRRLERSVEN
jgi:apolipoprotein N-acyltransferase